VRTAKGSLARESGGPCLESLALSACPFVLSDPRERNHSVFDFREGRGIERILILIRISREQRFSRLLLFKNSLVLIRG